MIALSISRDSLGLLPLSIADSGTGTYVLIAMEPGRKERANAVAESRWLPGGTLASSRLTVLTFDLSVRIYAATVPALQQAAADLDEAKVLEAKKAAEEAIRARSEKQEIATAEAELAAISAQLQAIQKLRKK